LLFFGQHRDVVLERIGYPAFLAADIRDALVVVPVVVARESLVDAVVKVFVMGEDNMATNVVELQTGKKANE
jgi:hypothetical protein